LRQPFGNLPQKRIAARPAETLVDVLEPLQVNNPQSHLALNCGGATNVLGHTLKKQAAVSQPGDFIVVGQVIQPLLFLQMIERKGNVSGQFRQ